MPPMETLPLEPLSFCYTTNSESGTEHAETLLDLLEAALADGDLAAAREACAALRDSSRSVRASAKHFQTLGVFPSGKVTAGSSFSLTSRCA